MSETFQRTLETLYGLERKKSDLGLDGTRALLGALGDPQQRFRSVHVAGTNGKGSVCALIERVLREADFRTGLYTSPHLVDFRERIRVNGRWVDADWLEAMLERIQGLPEGKGRTFFEVTTALGFAWFAEQRVDWAVVEVGLGGRLDSTNVITPEVSVITTIGLDHTEILGDTLEKIAEEKAGIIKPGVPVMTGVERDRPAARTLERVAAERGSPIVFPGMGETINMRKRGDEPTRASRWLEGSPWGERIDLGPEPPGIAGENQGLALGVLAELVNRGAAIPFAAVRRGLERTRWPGRTERSPKEPRLWWDGAHNPSGAMTLHRLLREPFGAIVLAFSRDKDVVEFLRVLHRDWPKATLIATRSRNERAMAPERIVAVGRDLGFAAEEAADVPSAIRRGLERAGNEPVLLTGSLFAIGEAMEGWGGAPGEQL